MAECEECLHNVVCELWRKEERQDAESVLTGGLSDCPIYKSASNIIALPCKVGDTVYQQDGVRIYESVIEEITIDIAAGRPNKMIFYTNKITFDQTAVGRIIFLTREEAEAALKERSKE